jgi:hypothetical protein
MGYSAPGMKTMSSNVDNSMGSNLANSDEERVFGEFRRKVRASEVLSASMERLLLSIRFSGELSVSMRDGRVHKTRYEEFCFRQGGKSTTAGETLAEKI